MNINDVLTFSYTGAAQNVTLEPGTYKLECWGAAGVGNKGGYARGNVVLSEKTLLNLYVGGAGVESVGGWNGGGSTSGTFSRAGGGASDIRIGGQTLYHRILVGGAGGGKTTFTNTIGGAGGGLVGESGGGSTGGTQTSGGNYGGTFGSAIQNIQSNLCGGGGGWFGGGRSTTVTDNGGGGSSYIGGEVIVGTTQFPIVPILDGYTEKGVKTGNGEIKITMLASVVNKKKRRFVQII